MDIVKKLMKIDYNNIYSIKRALTCLGVEFRKAENEQNRRRAKEIISLSEHLYVNFPSKINSTMLLWKNKMEKMYKYLNNRYGNWK